MKTAGIVAFAFGVPKTIRSNCRIAQIASQKARELNAPVYTQLDVPVDSGIEVEYTEEESGNPPPTLRIAQGAVRWAKRHGFAELWIVAAKQHIWRCRRDLKQAVREEKAQIVIHICKEIDKYPKDSWFCPDSTQLRTRSWRNFWAREQILKLIPFFLYKIVAS